MKLGYDIHLIFSLIILVGIGLLVHLSLSPENIYSHLVYACIGALVAGLLARFDLRWLRPFSSHVYVGILFLLVITMFFGTVARGSQRWLDLGLFRFQSSELIKPLLILVLADWLDRKRLVELSQVIRLGILAVAPVFLVLIQPDLGSAIIMSLIILSMFVVAGLDLKYILIGAVSLVLASPLVWVNLQSYQQDRIMTFVDPQSDPLGRGYNVIQSQIAVGSGQLLGRGLGHGTQSKLRFLPEYQTDFVFASLAEELGLLGSLVLILSFCYLIIRLSVLALSQSNLFAVLVITGVIAMIVSQMIINISMNLALMPVTGITLPFISAGGTSLVVSMASVGLVIGLASRRKISPGIEIKAQDK